MAKKQAKIYDREININGELQGVRGHQHETIKKFLHAQLLLYLMPRQHGKSWLVDEVLLDFIFKCERPSRFPHALIVCSTAGQAKAVHYDKEIKPVIDKLPNSLVHRSGGSSNSDRILITIKRPWFDDMVFITFAGARNIDALRGESVDLLICDETADFKLGSFFGVLHPMLGDTKGRGIITGTAKDRTSEFHNVYNAMCELQHDSPHLYAVSEFDIITARLRNEQDIEDIFRLAIASGNLASAMQEHMNAWDAFGSDEVPYSNGVRRLRQKRNMPYMRDATQLYASFDIGKPGNNPIWVWRPLPDGVIQLVGYSDKFNQYEAIDWLVNNYPEARVKVIYPHDANKPVSDTGIPLNAKMQQYVLDKGYKHRIFIDAPLEMNRNKVQSTKNSVILIDRAYADVKACKDGLNKLAGVRQKKDPKTGYIEFGKFSRNDYNHTGDAFRYVADAIDGGVVSAAPRSVRKVKYQSKYEARFGTGDV